MQVEDRAKVIDQLQTTTGWGHEQVAGEMAVDGMAKGNRQLGLHPWVTVEAGSSSHGSLSSIILARPWHKAKCASKHVQRDLQSQGGAISQRS